MSAQRDFPLSLDKDAKQTLRTHRQADSSTPSTRRMSRTSRRVNPEHLKDFDSTPHRR